MATENLEVPSEQAVHIHCFWRVAVCEDVRALRKDVRACWDGAVVLPVEMTSLHCYNKQAASKSRSVRVYSRSLGKLSRAIDRA